MNDGEALRRSVLARPHEDVPRLAFADWCDENGRPARARFVRLQCEREALPAWDARAIEIDEQLPELGLALWDDHFSSPDLFNEVLADIPDEVERAALAQVWSRSSSGDITNPCGRARLRRGFAEFFRLDDEDCTDVLERLPSLTPVATVRLRGRVGASAETVRRLPRDLRSLEVAPYWPAEADFRGLVGDLPPLSELSLEPPYGWDATRLNALLSELWPVLGRAWESLLVGFSLDATAIDRLAGCPGSVRSLSLAHVRGDGYDRLFRGAWAASFERIALRQYEGDHHIGAAGLGQLLAALAELPRLRSLDLRYFRLGSRAWIAFVRAGGLARCEEVSLSKNPRLGSAWLRHAVNGDRPTALRRLSARDCAFSNDHMRELARGPHPNLVWLDLSHVHSVPDAGVTAAGVAALVESPLREQLRALELYSHPVGDDGLRLLASREWPELRTLDVRCDAEQDAAADFLLRGQFPAMVRLDIGCRGPTDRLARVLGDVGPAGHPFTLHLRARLTDDNIPALLRSRYLASLRRIWFVYPAFSEAGKERLRAHFGDQLRV